MSPRPLLGIVGGMGPLASAELLATIYRENLPDREQEAPRCLLLSDPTFPDRTEAILRGETAALAERLESAVDSLLVQGADRVVIACFTAHALLGELPERSRCRVISLVDLLVDELAAEAPERVPRLLLATTGSRRAGVFAGHPRWPGTDGLVRDLPDEEQDDLHDLLYRLKRGEPPVAAVPRVRTLEERHGARGSIFGCTELHLLQRHLDPDHRERVIDPLLTVARNLDRLLDC